MLQKLHSKQKWANRDRQEGNFFVALDFAVVLLKTKADSVNG